MVSRADFAATLRRHFLKAKISKAAKGIDFQRDEAAEKHLGKPGKGVRILSPRFFFFILKVCNQLTRKLVLSGFLCFQKLKWGM